MKIISQFKDYYDGVMKTSYDPQIKYLRHTQILEVEKPGTFFRTSATKKTESGWEWLEAILYNIYFCGKHYPVLKIIRNTREVGQDTKEFPLGICVSEEEWDSKWKEKFENSSSRYYRARKKNDCWKQNHTDSYNVKYKSPIVILSTETIINPCLKDFEFQRIVDPYQAFQEISMYISGILGQEANPMVDISDKEMVAKKGFDNWSFRKRPSLNK